MDFGAPCLKVSTYILRAKRDTLTMQSHLLEEGYRDEDGLLIDAKNDKNRKSRSIWRITCHLRMNGFENY